MVKQGENVLLGSPKYLNGTLGFMQGHCGKAGLMQIVPHALSLWGFFCPYLNIFGDEGLTTRLVITSDTTGSPSAELNSASEALACPPGF